MTQAIVITNAPYKETPNYNLDWNLQTNATNTNFLNSLFPRFMSEWDWNVDMPENYHWILARLNKNRQTLNGTDIHEIEIDATGRFNPLYSISSELARANFSELFQLNFVGKLVSCL